MDKMIDKVKYSLLLIGIIVFYLSFGGYNSNFWQMILLSFSYQPLILILLFVMIFNVIKTINVFNTNYLVLCRFNNLKEYYKKIIKNIIKENFYILTIFIILVISVSLIGCMGNFTILKDDYYNISYLTIDIYYFTKLFILTNILSALSVVIYLTLKNNGLVMYTGLLLISSFSNDKLKNITISSITKYPIRFIDYVTYLHYDNILHDVLSYLLYISLLLLIISIFKHLFLRKRRDLI